MHPAEEGRKRWLTPIKIVVFFGFLRFDLSVVPLSVTVFANLGHDEIERKEMALLSDWVFPLSRP